MIISKLKKILDVAMREWRRMYTRPIYLFSSVFVMFFCYLFFITLFDEGLPRQIPIGVVDADNSSVSRTMISNINAIPQINIVKHYDTHTQAREAMQRAEIYGVVEIENGFEKRLLTSRQPNIIYYVNDTYLIAGSLAYKELTYISELGTAYVQQRLLHAKGIVGDENTMPLLQPIKMDTHLIGNPYTSYAIYLLNVLLPAVLQLLIIMLTIFSIGTEFKEKTVSNWLQTSRQSVISALIGKTLPYTILFCLLAIGGDMIRYRYLHFPMNGSLWWMSMATVLYVFSYQAIGIFIIGLLPRMRDAISLGAFYGLLAFTYAGFTFPIESMPYRARIFSQLFPIHHYFDIYVNEALNAAPRSDTIYLYIILMLFLFLPFFVYGRLRKKMLCTV